MKPFNFSLIKSLYADFLNILPKIIGFILFVIAGYFFVKIVMAIVKKLLHLARIDKLKEKLNDKLDMGGSFKIDPEKIILGFIKWMLILTLVIMGAEIFGLAIISQYAVSLLNYLPSLLTAIAIFVVGIYLASIVKHALQRLLHSFNLGGSKAMGLIIFYVIAVFVTVTALNQAGINTYLITDNISLILAIFLGTFGLALGLGSRDVVLRLILGFYSKRNFKIGDVIKIGDTTGVIISLDHISLVLKTNDGKIVYPIKQISNQKIEILGE